jgi:hypothetical protein
LKKINLTECIVVALTLCVSLVFLLEAGVVAGSYAFALLSGIAVSVCPTLVTGGFFFASFAVFAAVIPTSREAIFAPILLFLFIAMQRRVPSTGVHSRSRVLGSFMAEATLVYAVVSATIHGVVMRAWLPSIILAAISITLLSVVPVARFRARRRRIRLEARRERLRLEIDGRQWPPSYRVHAEPEDVRSLEDKLDCVETELASL